MRLGFGFWVGLAIFIFVYQVLFYPERTGHALYVFERAADGINISERYIENRK